MRKARKLAVDWLRKSSDAGYILAQYHLGRRLLFGDDVKQNARAGQTLLEQVAENKDDPTTAKLAASQLSKAFAQGVGRIKSIGSSLRWLQKADDQADQEVALSLAGCLARGEDCVRDAATAVKLYRRYAPRSPEAEYQLALHLANGDGVTKDVHEARRLLKSAAERRHQKARQTLETLDNMAASALPAVAPASAAPEAAPAAVAANSPAVRNQPAAPAQRQPEESQLPALNDIPPLERVDVQLVGIGVQGKGALVSLGTTLSECTMQAESADRQAR